jgi:hypothetical protein
MVFYYLADELRTGDVAVIGSEEYADWSEQLLPWEQVEEKLPEYLAEVGLAAPDGHVPFDGRALVAQLRGRLSAAAAAADGEYPDNDELFIDPDSGAPKLKARRAEKPRKSARVLEQAVKERMPERTLLGNRGPHRVLDRVVEPVRPGVRQRPEAEGPARPVRDHDVREGHEHDLAGVSGHELSIASRRHVTTAKLSWRGRGRPGRRRSAGPFGMSVRPASRCRSWGVRPGVRCGPSDVLLAGTPSLERRGPSPRARGG